MVDMVDDPQEASFEGETDAQVDTASSGSERRHLRAYSTACIIFEEILGTLPRYL